MRPGRSAYSGIIRWSLPGQTPARLIEVILHYGVRPPVVTQIRLRGTRAIDNSVQCGNMEPHLVRLDDFVGGWKPTWLGVGVEGWNQQIRWASVDPRLILTGQVAPWFQDFVLQPRREEPDEIQLEWSHRDSESYFDAFSLSDGSLRFICLCALLLQPEAPPLILLDEPELGLHPAALYLLGEMLNAVDAQLFVATQSSALVSYFRPEEIVVADIDAGKTTLTRLDSAKLTDWLERYSLGKLWEKNIIGGRP